MKITEEEIEFLENSNWIEKEYSDEALEDSIKTWKVAKKEMDLPDFQIDSNFIRRIHAIIMKRINKRIAGKFRKIQVGVMTEEGFKEAIHHTEIKEELYLLCNPGIYPAYTESLIKRWHIQFEHIHPFEDGNGRVGRILMNIQRLKEGLPLLIIHEGREQQNYYTWFKKNVETKEEAKGMKRGLK